MFCSVGCGVVSFGFLGFVFSLFGCCCFSYVQTHFGRQLGFAMTLPVYARSVPEWWRLLTYLDGMSRDGFFGVWCFVF